VVLLYENRGRERLIRQRPCAASPHRGSELDSPKSFVSTTWCSLAMTGKMSPMRGTEKAGAVPLLQRLAPVLSRNEGDLSAQPPCKTSQVMYQESTPARFSWDGPWTQQATGLTVPP